MKVKEESEKSWLNTQRSKNWDHGIPSITSWQIDGEKMKKVTDYFLWLQNHCGQKSHEIKRHLLLGRKGMTNLDSVLKSRVHIVHTVHYANKVHIVKAMAFPVVLYRCESWTIKKADSQRIDAFKLWCWRRL